MNSSITYGTVVEGLWSEPVEVIAYHQVGGGDFHIVGKLVTSREIIEQEITAAEAAELQVVSSDISFTGDARRVFLALEAKRYEYAVRYEPTFAISVSKVDPLPHQIEAVSQVLKQPRIRFLIADDPGAGKTIMAGLIAKELKLREQARRTLIVAPGHLITQWMQEMKTRFGENFTHVTRAFVNAYPHENVWERESQLITSMDFVKGDDIRDTVAKTTFDLIIVDEAHKMAAYQYGDKVEKTKRYQLGECLSQVTKHLLFLTATPHRGDSESFRLFLDLLEPGFFADADQIQASIAAGDNPLFIRRVKEVLKNFEGQPLFLPRHVRTKPFHLGADSVREMELYNALSAYIREQYNRFAENSQKRNSVAFALVILQRRLASSTHALLISLQRRQQRLAELLKQATYNIKGENIPSEAEREELEELEELTEEERWALEEQWEVLSVAENREELSDEIETLRGLEDAAQRIIEGENELKLKELKKALDELNHEHPNEKVLIFTEYFDTLTYLSEKVKAWGFSVSVIDGKMPHEKRIAAQEAFRAETQILIATEAAGEGINLQFCHLMINYDLPWNPNRLEQRMGRIHRYGQKREVHIINLVAADTREGKVFTRLFEKLDTIRQELGTHNVYDVIGELFPKRNLAQIMLEAAASTRDYDELLSTVEKTLEPVQLDFLNNFNQDTLVSRHINLAQVKELQQYARENGLIPEYTREFFQKTFAALGVALQPKDRFYSIPRIPRQIQRILEDSRFRQTYPNFTADDYRKVTFDKADATTDASAVFLSFGHPLFEATLRYVTQTYTEDLKAGACFEDPDGLFHGVIVFYEGAVQDGANTIAGKRLFAFYLPQGSESVEQVNPMLLWDLQEAAPKEEPLSIQVLKEKVEPHLRDCLEAYKQELTQERQRHVDIKRKYGIASLDQLILELDGELLALSIRDEAGEDVRLVRHNKAEQKGRYEEERVRLETTCQQEVQLQRKPGTFLGAIRVTGGASEEVPTEDYSISEIEDIGMAHATEYEQARGAVVEDVASENLGFDLRSQGADGTVRCIEVKARSEHAPVVLTANEWFRAKQLKESYFLYVILNAATEPELHIIQDPANRVRAVRQVTEVRYQIPLSEVTGAQAPIKEK